MLKNKPLFDQLVRQGWEAGFSGWDFSFVDGRMVEQPPPWDYHRIVWERSRTVASLLDIGTGGGEFLSTLQPFPPETYATEAYPPNVLVAKACLEPLGVRVIAVTEDAPIPLASASLDLTINRHASYSPAELFRLLKPGGRFITQQVGGSNCLRLNEFLQEKVEFVYSYWTLDYAIRELQEAGFTILEQHEAYPEMSFHDIGAVVYYLKVISWQVAGFTPETHLERLVKIHNIIQETGSFIVHEHRFLVDCVK